MKSIILFITLSSAICISCSNKRQQLQPEATPDKEPAITGGNDTATNIRISSQDTLPDKDTIVYDIPECCLWYAKDLPDEYKDKPVSMWRNMLYIGRMCTPSIYLYQIQRTHNYHSGGIGT